MDPTRCVVVEHSPFSVAGAEEAGMRCLGFAALTEAARPEEADAVFSDMAELPRLVASRR